MIVSQNRKAKKQNMMKIDYITSSSNLLYYNYFRLSEMKQFQYSEAKENVEHGWSLGLTHVLTLM